MLKIAYNLQEIHFSQLMEIYVEGNFENGAQRHPNLCCNQQLLMAEQDFYNYLSSVFFRTPGAFYALLELEGRYQSAVRIEPYSDGLLLAGLETRPEARRQGHAQKLIDSVCAFLGEKGSCKLYSHVNKRNIPSIRTHEKCGFTAVLDYAVYSDGSVMRNAYTFCRQL